MKHFAKLCALPMFAITLLGCGSKSDEGDSNGATSGNGQPDGSSVLTGNDDTPLFGGIGAEGGAMGPLGQDDSDASCGGSSLMASQVPINLLVVLDRSGSMDSTPDGFSLNKWDAIRQALQGALEATQDRLTVGLELYPHDPDTEIPLACDPAVCCTMPDTYSGAIVVSLAPGASAVPDIVTTLDGVGPGGGTPTATALAFALDYFESAEGQALAGDKYVLLATDGGPNCNSNATCDAQTCTANIDNDLPFDQNQCDPAGSGPAFCIDGNRTIAAASALADAGVKTIVVGIPGTEAYADVLDAVAVAGGAPNTSGTNEYYAVTTGGGVSGLETTLRDITTELIRSCELQLESTPPDPTKVNVRIDGEFIPFLNTDGASGGNLDAAIADAAVEPDLNGWTLDETTSPPTVVLQGAPCDLMLQSGAENVEVVFGCPRVEIDLR